MSKVLKNWSLFELVWLVAFTVMGIFLSVYWQESPIGFIAFLTGIICVVLVAKGSIWNYAFGVVNAITYAYVSYQALLYGEVMLNLIYFLPMQLIGFLMWRKHMNQDVKEVERRKLSAKGIIFILSVTIIGIAAYNQVLMFLGGNLTWLDSTTNIVSIVAAILMNLRYREQWLLWIVVNIVSVIMWWFVRQNLTIALMWFAYLINAIYGYYKWSKDTPTAEIDVN